MFSYLKIYDFTQIIIFSIITRLFMHGLENGEHQRYRYYYIYGSADFVSLLVCNSACMPARHPIFRFFCRQIADEHLRTCSRIENLH